MVSDDLRSPALSEFRLWCCAYGVVSDVSRKVGSSRKACPELQAHGTLSSFWDMGKGTSGAAGSRYGKLLLVRCAGLRALGAVLHEVEVSPPGGRNCRLLPLGALTKSSAILDGPVQ